MTDIIILLDGNFASVRVDDKNVKGITDQIKEILRGNVDPVNKMYILGNVTVLIDRIIGYYTRPVVESAQDKLVKLVEKTLDQSSEGEGWKS